MVPKNKHEVDGQFGISIVENNLSSEREPKRILLNRVAEKAKRNHEDQGESEQDAAERVKG